MMEMMVILLIVAIYGINKYYKQVKSLREEMKYLNTLLDDYREINNLLIKTETKYKEMQAHGDN